MCELLWNSCKDLTKFYFKNSHESWIPLYNIFVLVLKQNNINFLSLHNPNTLTQISVYQLTMLSITNNRIFKYSGLSHKYLYDYFTQLEMHFYHQGRDSFQHRLIHPLKCVGFLWLSCFWFLFLITKWLPSSRHHFSHHHPKNERGRKGVL